MPKATTPRGSIEKSQAQSQRGHSHDQLVARAIQQRPVLVAFDENSQPPPSARAERYRKRERAQDMVAVKADPAEDPQLPHRPDPEVDLRLQTLGQKKARLEKRVDKLRQNTLDLWRMADGYHAQLHNALAQRNISIEEMRRAEKRVERAELAERAWQEERAGLYEELRLSEERRYKDERIDLVAKLRQAEEQAEQANLSWEKERAELQEGLRAAKERLDQAEPAELAEKLKQAEERAEQIGLEWKEERAELQKELREAEKHINNLESTDMAKNLQEAEERAKKERSRALSFWLALSKERRGAEQRQKALENDSQDYSSDATGGQRYGFTGYLGSPPP